MTSCIDCRKEICGGSTGRCLACSNHSRKRPGAFCVSCKTIISRRASYCKTCSYKIVSEKMKRRYAEGKHPWLGRKHSLETRLKMSTSGKLAERKTRASIIDWSDKLQLREYRNAYNCKNRERVNKYSRNAAKLRLQNKRQSLFSLIGEECNKCGEKRIDALQFDHKQNDGQEDRRRLTRPIFYTYYLKHLAEALSKLQTLCANCNRLKHIENSEQGNAYISHYRQKTRNRLVDMLGGKCVECSLKDRRLLCFDHINGGGLKERRKFKSYIYGFYNQYLKNPTLAKGTLQLLCYNCNWLKQRTQKEYHYKYAI